MKTWMKNLTKETRRTKMVRTWRCFGLAPDTEECIVSQQEMTMWIMIQMTIQLLQGSQGMLHTQIHMLVRPILDCFS